MDAEEIFEFVINAFIFVAVFCPVAIMSGHMIAHHVKRNIHRFQDPDPRPSFWFGVYCTLCVALSYGLLGFPVLAALWFFGLIDPWAS